MDRVRTESQERLDKEDIDALGQLPYEAFVRALGGFLGNVVGCMSPVVVAEYGTDGEGAYWTTLAPFAFWHSAGQATRTASDFDGDHDVVTTWGTQLVTLDPTRQSAQVDYSGARNAAVAYVDAHPGANSIPDGTASALPYLWARPTYIDEDEDARRVWSMDLGREVSRTFATRSRHRAEFVYADARPEAGDGAPWVAVGKVVRWTFSGGAPLHPVLVAISMWDRADLLTWTKETGGILSDSANNSTAGLLHTKLLTGSADPDHDLAAYPTTDRDVGLVRILYLLRNRLRRHLAGGTGDPGGTPARSWLDLPKYSLRGLQKLVDDTISPALAELSARPRAWKALLRVAVTRATEAPYELTSVQWIGDGIESVTLSKTDGGGNVEGFFIVKLKPSVFAGAESDFSGGKAWTVVAHPMTIGIAASEKDDFRVVDVRVLDASTLRVSTFRVLTEPVAHGYTESISDVDYVSPFWMHHWTSFSLEVRGPSASAEWNDITP